MPAKPTLIYTLPDAAALLNVALSTIHRRRADLGITTCSAGVTETPLLTAADLARVKAYAVPRGRKSAAAGE